MQPLQSPDPKSKFLAVLFLLQISLTTMAAAAGEPPVEPASPKEAVPALAELSISKQPATILLTLTTGANKGQPFRGAFISNDGLALVNLTSLAWEDLPEVTTWDGTKIKFRAILGIFPEPELALVKFNHRPKVWLNLSNKEPQLGESLAMVFAQNRGLKRRLEGKTPPVVGPVMARRTSRTSTNLKNSFFHTILSLGAGLTAKQRAEFSPGIFAINANGDLVAVSGGLRPSGNGQTLIILPPITHLFDEISRLSKGQQAIPRADVKNHVDTTLVDDDFRTFNLAQISGNNAKVRVYLTKLIKRYPQNLSLKHAAIPYDLRDDQGTPIISLTDFEPDPESSKAKQVSTLLARAKFLMQRQDTKAAIGAIMKAIKLSPEDHSEPLSLLADIYLRSRRVDEARSLLEKIHPLMSDSIAITEALESILIKERKLDEADKLSKKIHALYKIYRR